RQRPRAERLREVGDLGEDERGEQDAAGERGAAQRRRQPARREQQHGTGAERHQLSAVDEERAQRRWEEQDVDWQAESGGRRDGGPAGRDDLARRERHRQTAERQDEKEQAGALRAFALAQALDDPGRRGERRETEAGGDPEAPAFHLRPPERGQGGGGEQRDEESEEQAAGERGGEGQEPDGDGGVG